MAQNYAAAHLAQIDERYSIDAVTGEVINKSGIRLDFNGKNSVTIYNVDTVSQVNYLRSGTNRFGALTELGTATQTFTLSQDKAFTFSVDRGNLEDSMMVQEANKAVKRQIREVNIKAFDVYVLAAAHAAALAASQGDTAAVTSSNAYNKFLAQNDAMTEALVPESGRHCFMTPATYSLLKQDTSFARSVDETQRRLDKGVLGQVDGVTLCKVPSGWLPTNEVYLFIHENVLIAPHKFNSVRILTDVQGIDGAVAEGREYYDCFVPDNKVAGLRYHLSA
ncbi:MAG: hypothetical protein U1C12_00185 [Patescibacteria group bacterium]|nr:hypothetical protein [Patescibacteria group bacterium]